MFTKLFALRGLSLDRLRALVEVGAAGGISRTAHDDPVKQSQYSRQIKELEDFFQTELVERHGKGIRLTANGRELARISRFFLMGLAHFQRGCLDQGQIYRLGACATFIEHFLLPVVSHPKWVQSSVRYGLETMTGDEVERRLHDLTLDFGIISQETLSRPLQKQLLHTWQLDLWVPASLCATGMLAIQAFREKRLPLVLPAKELPASLGGLMTDYEPVLACNNFLEAKSALENQSMAAFLPDFMAMKLEAANLLRLQIEPITSAIHHYSLAWNPRLLRLNPAAARQRDFLLAALAVK